MNNKNLEVIKSSIKNINDKSELDDIIETAFYQKSNIDINEIHQNVSNISNTKYLKKISSNASNLYIQTNLILKAQQMKEYCKLSDNVYGNASQKTKDIRINAARAITNITPNLGLTLNFNPTIMVMGDFDLERAIKTMNHIFKELNVIFKFDGYYTFEHFSTNIHAHLALKVIDVPSDTLDTEWIITTEDIIKRLWKKYIPNGDVWLSPIYDIDGWSNYVVKLIQKTEDLIPTPKFDVL